MIVLPVSYTHLDVYKRQRVLSAKAELFLPNEIIQQATIQLCRSRSNTFEITGNRDMVWREGFRGPYAVSYTHLDVYKRQYIPYTPAF